MKKLSIALLLVAVLGCGEQSSTEYLSSAKAHIQNKDFGAATIELKNALRIEPTQAEARFLLGQMYLQQRQYENAEKEFERALEYKYPASEVVPLLSKTYQKTGADNALLKLSLKMAGLKADDVAEVNFYKLQAMMRLEQQEKAKKLIHEIKALDSKSPFKQLALVYALLLDDEGEAAAIQLDSIIAQHPKQPDALKLKADLLMQSRDIESAIAIYRQYVALYPDDLQMSFIFARLLTDTNQSAEAEPILDRLLQVNKSNPLLNQLKSLARFTAHDYAPALSFAEIAIQENPNDNGLRLVAGVSAYFTQDYQKAQQHLSFIAQDLPPSHQALRLLAAAQLKLGLTMEANDIINQIDNISAQDSSLLSATGLALVQQGEMVKAKAVLAQAPAAGESSDALMKLGMLKLSLNDVSGVMNLEAALAKSNSNSTADADNRPIKQILATAYLSTEQLDKALALAEQWQIDEPNSIAGFMLAGQVQAKRKDYAQAKAEFDAALLLEPNNPKINMNLVGLIPALNPDNTKEQLARLITTQVTSILSAHPDYVPAIKYAYVLAKQAGNTDDIMQQVRKISKKQPANLVLQLTLAEIYYAEQKFQSAVATLEPLATLPNKPVSYWQLLGQSYIELTAYPKAVQHFQAWLTAEPNNTSAMLGNILVLESQGKIEQALTLVQQITDKQGETLQLQLLKTHLLLRANNVKQAELSYQTLPEQVLNMPMVRGFLGQLQLHRGEFQRALPNLQTAYHEKATPQNARAVYLCLTKLNQAEAAYQFLVTHVKQSPTDVASTMILAMTQIALEPTLAIASYQQVLQVNQENFIAHNNLAFLLMEQRQLVQAEQHARVALKLQPENPDVLDTLGTILLLQGEHQAALKQLARAVAIDPNKVSEQIYLHYIEALLKNNELALAKRKIADYRFSAKHQAKLNELKQQYQL